jgi:NADPH-dependent 2,4-dienoyl-CoA reductase/sulfur reductase-like enzyme
VEMRFATFATEAEVCGENPDVVFIATGGVPNTELLRAGNEFVVSSWDALSGQVKPAGRALVFDDNGAHPGMQAAEMLAEAGAAVELVSPERFFAPEMGGLNHALYARAFQRLGVRVTINSRLVAVRREGNALVATIGSDYGSREEERVVDQVVVEHGTLPVDELYHALKPRSINLGAVDYEALVAGEPQTIGPNPDGAFRLFRIGDAVASRNIHAAVYDGLRYAKDL